MTLAPGSVISYNAPERIEKLEVIDMSISALIKRSAKRHGFENLSIPLAIIHCESTTNPNAIGLRAVIGKDIGLWQINDFFHEENAKKLGLDIYQLEDNLEYGFMLLKKEGTTPWNSSKGCWSKLI